MGGGHYHNPRGPLNPDLNGDRKIINYNKYLFGPGPVRRAPKSGFGAYYANMPPVRGFSMAAFHGIVLSLAGGLGYKYFFGDPQIRSIEQYYIDNPPR